MQEIGQRGRARESVGYWSKGRAGYRKIGEARESGRLEKGGDLERERAEVW